MRRNRGGLWPVRRALAGARLLKSTLFGLTPADAGVAKIGHFGFFRPEHRDTLWRGAAEWLQAE